MTPEQRDSAIHVVQQIKDGRPGMREGLFDGPAVDAALWAIEADVVTLAAVMELLLREHEGMQR